jgi:hypothetical protein
MKLNEGWVVVDDILSMALWDMVGVHDTTWTSIAQGKSEQGCQSE